MKKTNGRQLNNALKSWGADKFDIELTHQILRDMEENQYRIAKYLFASTEYTAHEIAEKCKNLNDKDFYDII